MSISSPADFTSKMNDRQDYDDDAGHKSEEGLEASQETARVVKVNQNHVAMRVVGLARSVQP